MDTIATDMSDCLLNTCCSFWQSHMSQTDAIVCNTVMERACCEAKAGNQHAMGKPAINRQDTPPNVDIQNEASDKTANPHITPHTVGIQNAQHAKGK